jgi:geranylgeranyl diphosphate synthase type 3
MYRFTRNINSKILKRFSTIGGRKKLTELNITQILENYKTIFNKSKVIEEIIPRKFKNEAELRNYFNVNSISSLLRVDDKVTLDSIQKSVNDPMWDMLDRGGKRWRPFLGLMIAKYLNIEIEDFNQNKNLYKILGAIEVIHNATLMIDDVVDNSEYRRSKPCIHKIFGK